MGCVVFYPIMTPVYHHRFCQVRESKEFRFTQGKFKIVINKNSCETWFNLLLYKITKKKQFVRGKGGNERVRNLVRPCGVGMT